MGPRRMKAGCPVLVGLEVWTLLGLCNLDPFLNKGARDKAGHRKPQARESRNRISVWIFIIYIVLLLFQQTAIHPFLSSHTHAHMHTWGSPCSTFNSQAFGTPHVVLFPPEHPMASLPTKYPSPSETLIPR